MIAHPGLELVGMFSHSPEKVGRDAGDLCRAGVTTGVIATDDAGALLALRPDCVVYAAVGETRPRDAVADLVRILSAGVNVASVSMMDLIDPASAHAKSVALLEQACAAGGASLFTTGLDPGFTFDALPMAAVQLCREIRSVRVQELGLYGDHPDPGWGAPYGFGLPPGAPAPLLDRNVPTRYWGGAVRSLARLLDIELDDVVETVERCYADEAFDVPMGHMAKGSLVAVRFQVSGLVAGVPRVVADHVTRMHPDVAPEWPRPPAGQRAVHRVVVEGDPDVTLDLHFGGGTTGTAMNDAAAAATAARAVNAVPAVVAAPPGIVTFADLSL